MKTLLVAMLLVLTLNAKLLFSNDEQVQNSKYIGALKDLILATQKTRGLTNNYLLGNTVSLLLVYNSRDNMKKAIGEMESLPLASDPVINKRATSISQSLIKLNRKAFRKKPAYVFSEYTALIEETLMLAQSVSKRSVKKLNPLGRDLSVVMMETMLPLTEYIGQMRGMGSGIIAKKEISKMQYAQMQVMGTKVKSLTRKLIISIKEIRSMHNGNCDATMSIKLKKLQKSSDNYIALTNKEILQKTTINYDIDKYFQYGTNLISDVISIYDVTNQVILKDSKGWI